MQPLIDATNTFLSSLDPGQREAVHFDVDGEIWRTWSNIHRNLMRHGLCLAELSDQQRELAYGILRAGVGQRAYETARNAMKLNEHLAELTGLPANSASSITGSVFLASPRRMNLGVGSSMDTTATSIASSLATSWCCHRCFLAPSLSWRNPASTRVRPSCVRKKRRAGRL